MRTLKLKLVESQLGVTVIEYSLLLALISLVVISSIGIAGEATNDTIFMAANAIEDGGTQGTWDNAVAKKTKHRNVSASARD